MEQAGKVLIWYHSCHLETAEDQLQGWKRFFGNTSCLPPGKNTVFKKGNKKSEVLELTPSMEADSCFAKRKWSHSIFNHYSSMCIDLVCGF
ncbi:hypothetical protein scyTo_0006153 [Scyliorhinus torazame]|uniref:Uncharacterized protein n=1 Tax=Scyliorhinus torazame TaxID=75743 RepID=A0A401PFZ3_SCYTO|nr:hypothetical protein [Scyliorhinus torazame]